ncbi:hypothetical protein D778_00168 [Xanthomarina gelatinilytica]|uniref:Uncharacterized protein n=1 Tax=Xanthomarina gelatinilytica TaxID=1137281 RepID=M7N935_9FLAO|nr:hypothetical protein [Xanthomarina gelatinilytica]EMQ94998.1 hypothetical protein D778_00168 [Xanthomarina gelatinilytica]
MTNEIIEFISSSEMTPSKNGFVHDFNISTSKTEITSSKEKSFLVSDFESAVKTLKEIPLIDNGMDIEKNVQQNLKQNSISEQEPFWLVVSVKDIQPNL